ncbi:MAG: hypothetical protein ACR2GF_05255 [Acidimicrobiales bacterium]
MQLSYRESPQGQILEEGITEAGSMGQLHRRQHLLRHVGRAHGAVLHLTSRSTTRTTPCRRCPRGWPVPPAPTPSRRGSCGASTASPPPPASPRRPARADRP